MRVSGLFEVCSFARTGRPLIVVCLGLAAFIAGCSVEPSHPRIVMLALDGMDPEVIDLLVSEGKLPHFARLRQEGAYGRLHSLEPLLSPIIWTTIATGKQPTEHGIGHFVAINERSGQELPVTSQMRRVKALWNIFSDAGRHVAVVGWWATWPAETVNGQIVSDHTGYHFLFRQGAEEERETPGQTWPESLAKDIAPLMHRPTDLTREALADYVDVDDTEWDRPFDFQDDLSHFKWAYATAESYQTIGVELWSRERPDLLMVYIEGVDSTSHLFGHLFRAEGLKGELEEQRRRYGRAVEKMYEYADALVGVYIDAMDADTTLVVLSDHGFALGQLPEDPSKTRDMRRVSERHHRIEGILYLYGYGVQNKAKLGRPSVLDIAPTMLALSGIAPPRDMPGRVLSEAFRIELASERVASYETGHAAPSEVTADANVDAAVIERLRSLGYLDTSSPKGDRNVAGALFESGRYEEAVAAFHALVKIEPEDGALRASLAAALGALGRYDEALEQLQEATRLAPLDPEAYHNRAVIYEQRGDIEHAIASYQEALRYDFQYRPSLEALQRLGAPLTAHKADDASTRRALEVAEQASQAARRGDYATAMKLLDEAERLGPNLALVYQYRANVAYLMGDRDRAIQALEKALAIEPDNALYRTNLERLRQKS